MGSSHDPAMHTAEHVLNQTMVRMFGCSRCFSSHINPKKSKVDYHFERPLTEGEVEEITRRVNDALGAGHDVTEENMPIGEARETFDLGRLPDPTVTEVRIVRVGDYDACPCIGTHVENTKEVGEFRLTTHSFADGVLRLRFKLG